MGFNNFFVKSHLTFGMQQAKAAFFIILLVLAGTFSTHAQEAIEISNILSDKDEISTREISRVNSTVIVSDTLRGWDYNWVGGLNGAQASYENWSQGGVNTITVTASTVFNLHYRKDNFAYAFSTNLKYGKARLEGDGNRKTDDRIAVNNKFSYLFEDDRWSAFGNFNFATQFDKGFNYGVPDDEDPILISRFFSPAYFTQIVGIAFRPAPTFNAEAGMAMKQTIVSDTSLSTRYGLAEGEQVRFEPGYSVAMNYTEEIFPDVKLSSSVETFTNLQRQLTSTDISFTNELIGKINDKLNTTLQFVVIYDDDFSKKAQIKQVLSVGFSFSIL